MQERAEHAAVDVLPEADAARPVGVDLVEEDTDETGGRAGDREDLPQPRLGLAVVHAAHGSGRHVEEARLGVGAREVGCDRARE